MSNAKRQRQAATAASLVSSTHVSAPCPPATHDPTPVQMASSSPTRTSPLLRLNDDCLVTILGKLDLRGVIRASHVNRWTRAVALATPALWTDLQWNQTLSISGLKSLPRSRKTEGRLNMGREAFTTLLTRSGATDLRLSLSLHVAAPFTKNPNETRASLAELTLVLYALRLRIIDLTLDVHCPGLVSASPLLNLDLPRLSRLALGRTDIRILGSGGLSPNLQDLAYLEGGCAFWRGATQPAWSVRALEVQAVIMPRDGWLADAEGGVEGAWLNAIMRVFPQLETLKIWESFQDANDWQRASEVGPASESSPTTPLETPILRSLDVRRLGTTNPWPRSLVRSLCKHKHVGLHAITQAQEFDALLLSSTSESKVRRIVVSAGRDRPFNLSSPAGVVFGVDVELTDGRTRGASMTGAGLAAHCMREALVYAEPDCGLVLDGAHAADVFSDVRWSTRSLDHVASVTMDLASVWSIPAVNLTSPALRNIVVRAKAPGVVAVDPCALKSLLDRFNTSGGRPELALIGCETS